MSGTPAVKVDEVVDLLKMDSEQFNEATSVLAQLFDVGSYPRKPLKDLTKQTPAIHSIAPCVIYFGTETEITRSPKVRENFKTTFESKLSRRSIFAFIEEMKTEKQTFSDIDEFFDAQDALSARINSQIIMNKGRFKSTAIELLRRDPETPFELSNDANKAYMAYKEVCSGEDLDERADEKEFRHRPWRMLKLAGIFALANQHKEITVQDVHEAMSVVGSVSGDMKRLKDEMTSSNVNVLVKLLLEHGKLPRYNELITDGLVDDPKSNNKLFSHLVDKVSPAFDVHIDPKNEVNMIAVDNRRKTKIPITIIETEKYCTGLNAKQSKDARRTKVSSNLTKQFVDFIDIADILNSYKTIIPFQFTGDTRRKDYVISTTGCLILDIDNSLLSIDEAFQVFHGYRRIIVTTSNNRNMHKFRLVLELNENMEIDQKHYRELQLWAEGKLRNRVMHKMKTDDDMTVDKLAREQAMYGYEKSVVKMSVELTDAYLDVDSIFSESKSEDVAEELDIVVEHERMEDELRNNNKIIHVNTKKDAFLFKNRLHYMSGIYSLKGYLTHTRTMLFGVASKLVMLGASEQLISRIFELIEKERPWKKTNTIKNMKLMEQMRESIAIRDNRNKELKNELSE